MSGPGCNANAPAAATSVANLADSDRTSAEQSGVGDCVCPCLAATATHEMSTAMVAIAQRLIGSPGLSRVTPRRDSCLVPPDSLR